MAGYDRESAPAEDSRPGLAFSSNRCRPCGATRPTAAADFISRPPPRLDRAARAPVVGAGAGLALRHAVGGGVADQDLVVGAPTPLERRRSAGHDRPRPDAGK